MKNANVIDLFMSRRGNNDSCHIAMRSARTCPRCGGEGTFLSGEKCYYCQGTGEV